MPSVRRPFITAALWGAAATTLVLLVPDRADAYVGPGAGFAFLSSLLTLLTTALLSLGAFLLWPFRKLWRLVRQPRLGPVFARRLVIVGFDGQDAGVTERLMSEGRLPNLKRLASADGYRRIDSAKVDSRAAWNRFANGVDAGQSLDPSVPFWRVLGERGIWSAVLRVPGMFPPVRFHGAQLSEATVDVDSSLGAYALYTTRPAEDGRSSSRVVRVSVSGGEIHTSLAGPPSRQRGRTRVAPLRITVHRESGEATVTVSGSQVRLKAGHLSGWTELRFSKAPGFGTRGMCRFLLLEAGEQLSLYVTPIHVDPERPGLRISHPRFYSAYLAKRIGKFGTLDLSAAADAVAAGAIDVPGFLTQVDANEDEREALLHAALDRLRRGSVVCVFDGARRVRQVCGDSSDLDRICEGNDAIAGRILAALRQDDLLVIVSPDGVLFANRPIDAKSPSLIDLAPTALRALGVEPPPYMKGAPVFDFGGAAGKKAPASA